MQEMPRNRRKIIELIIYFGGALFLVAVDFLTKFLANAYLPYMNNVVVIPNVVSLYLTYNTGAAFSLGEGNIFFQILFCLFSYVVAVLIIYYFIKKSDDLDTFLKICLAIILGGDVGNLIDRTFALLPIETMYSRGVIDFINVNPLLTFIVRTETNFGVFNGADSFLVIGIILLLIYLIIDTVKGRAKNK